VNINPDAFIRFRNFNPPTFCLVYAINSGAGIHEVTPHPVMFVIPFGQAVEKPRK